MWRKEERFHFTMENLHQIRYERERGERGTIENNNYDVIIIIIERSAKADPLQ